MVHTRFFKTVLLCGAVVAFLATAAAPAMAQGTGTIRGTVTEAGSGTPIMGAQIHVLGTRLTAISEEDGTYQIANVPVGSIDIRVRMIGYSRVAANANLTANLPLELNFEMRQSVIALEAVVVTGAGAAVEKKQLGNTIATVDMARIEQAPVQTFSEVLAGREPSVNVAASGGISGAGARIRIRGSSSLSMSNEPVVYVDGVRIDNGGGMTNVGSAAASMSRLDDISPESIDRIEVLKGAAAATLYGSEASNGVIQIFTKTGRAGHPRFSFRIEQGISMYPADAWHPNAGFARDQAQADDMNELYGNTPGWTNVAPYEVFERTFLKDLMGTGHLQTYSASVTGGGETVNYFVSGRFNRDDGPLAANDIGPTRDVARNIQGTASITVFPRERLSFRLGMLYTDRQNTIPTNGNNIYGVYSLGMFGKPELSYCDDVDGDGNQDVTNEVIGETTPVCEFTGNTTGNAAFMTARESLQAERQQDAEHFNGNITASFQAADRLNFEATFGIDVTNSQNFWFRYFGSDVDEFTGNSREGARSIGQRNHREITLDVKGIWDERFGAFSSQFTAGFQGFISTDKTSGGDGDVFPGPGLEIVGAAANVDIFENWLQVVNTGAFAQEQIGFNDYAYFTVGGRWDRNSAFGENTGGAFYPKASISLVFSDMPMWSSSLISTLRVRGALGRSGLQPGAFDKFQTFQSGTTTLGAGLIPANLGNEDLAPEKSTEIEVGAEVGLFDNILGLEATYWDRTTTDALVQQQFPVSGGFTALQLVNIGELAGKGLELKFDWLTLDRENLSITTFATASWIDEKIISMGTAPPIKVGGSYPRYRNFLMPPFDEDGDGELDYFTPGSYFGGALVDYDVNSTVPFDTDGDGDPDSVNDFRNWLASDAGDGAGVHYLSDSELSPLLRDDDGDGDLLDTYLGKPSPDWSGSFGATITFMNNLDLNTLFEYKTGEFFITNLTDAFRKSNSLIGRNTPEAAAAEAAMENPNATVDEKFDAAMEWAEELKGLSPHSGLNTIYDGKFLAMREIGLTWRAPSSFAGQLGLSNLAFNLTGRNLLKFTPYNGIDPESNYQATTTGGGVGNNFGDSIDAFGTPLPRRFTVSVQFGF